ncbi:MAG: hypothetical protein CMB73_05535 [Euryarchaeota archaeon]|nr:hypothetical protein [Euryarchaeota archaeon]|tara:strand:+ start:564 stop:1127 length:564 start_codon:yes stop_codon:yes gene_type:complete
MFSKNTENIFAVVAIVIIGICLSKNILDCRNNNIIERFSLGKDGDEDGDKGDKDGDKDDKKKTKKADLIKTLKAINKMMKERVEKAMGEMHLDDSEVRKLIEDSNNNIHTFVGKAITRAIYDVTVQIGNKDIFKKAHVQEDIKLANELTEFQKSIKANIDWLESVGAGGVGKSATKSGDSSSSSSLF